MVLRVFCGKIDGFRGRGDVWFIKSGFEWEIVYKFVIF